MPHSKTKKIRRRGAQKGKRGKIRARMSAPTRRGTIRRTPRKLQQRRGQLPPPPLQVGPSVETTRRFLQIANHHAIHGNYAKSAAAFAIATASAGALVAQHPHAARAPMVPPEHDHLSGPGANIFPGYFKWQTHPVPHQLPTLSRKEKRKENRRLRQAGKKNTQRTRRRHKREQKAIRHILAASTHSRNPRMGKLNYRRGKRGGKTRRAARIS